jgi:carboxymethylenebutenolidase
MPKNEVHFALPKNTKGDTNVGKMIELVASDGHKLAAYRAEPKGKPRGGLIVVQEIFGVNSHIKGVADGYAADGYLTIAPAFFDRAQRGVDLGYSQADTELGRTFVPKMQWDNIMKDAQAGMEDVKSAGGVGILGFCWGGTVAWIGAGRLAGLACSVCYYGGRIPDMANEQPKSPVMFHWGETDHAIPIDAAKKVAATHPEAQSFIYKAGHGFNCDQRGSYHAESAKLARTRTLEFLKKHIG